jgi:hypothetical protein
MSQSTPTRRPARLPAVERRARNARIAEARESGEAWKPIADREGLSVKQARRARDEHLATATEALPPMSVAALVERAVRAQVLALDCLEAKTRSADNDSARVGAAKNLSTVGIALVDLLAKLGRIGDPAKLRYDQERRALAAAIFDFAAERGLDSDELRETVLGMRLLGAGLVGAASFEEESL